MDNDEPALGDDCLRGRDRIQPVGLWWRRDRAPGADLAAPGDADAHAYTNPDANADSNPDANADADGYELRHRGISAVELCRRRQRDRRLRSGR
jgi:hypothetical protein